MAVKHNRLEKHQKYLAKVPREVLRKRLGVFRLKEEVMEVLPFVCLSFKVKFPFTEYKQWLHPLDPVSLDDLKNWFGVPNEAAKRLAGEPRKFSIRANSCVDAANDLSSALPMMHHYEFESLDHEQRLAVRQTANSLLYGYADPEKVSRPPLSGVVDYMISAIHNVGVNIMIIPELIVCPDNVVEFENIPALFFNNILIYGNGRIITKSKTKIHSFQIRHVDA